MRRRAVALAAVTLLLSALVTAPPASAATINVVGCGADALIAAIEAANDETAHPGGDTIHLEAGCTYTLTAPYGSESSSFGLPSIATDVVIVGHGATIERQDPTGAYGFFSVGTSASLLLSGLTLANGAGYVAGFIHNGGDMTIQNSTVRDNTYGNNNTAIINEISGAMNILNSSITNHLLPLGGAGGAVRNRGSLVVVGSTFSGNAVINIAGGPALQVGGAIDNTGTATIYSSVFTGNRTGAAGGAISNGGDLKIYDSSFVGNSANFGAAIDNSADLVVERSYFEDNRAVITGGAIYNSSSAVGQVFNSSFFNNRASTGGGAVANALGMRIEHSTFSNNTASSGASIYSPTGLLRIETSILNGPGSHCSGNITDFDANLVYPSLGTCPSTFAVADPKLSSPALRGGPTKTMGLGGGSAAVDHAPTTGCPSVDQRGMPRPAGPACDSGAFEDQVPTTPGAPAVTSGGNPNRGQFTLEWPASNDPDGQVLLYRLYHLDADDPIYALVGEVSMNPHWIFGSTPEAEGTFHYRVLVTDGNHTSGFSAASAAVVVDKSAPTSPTASPDRSPDFTAPGAALGWYRDTVTVTFAGSTDPLLLDGSGGSGVASITTPQTFTTSGPHTALGSAIDNAGNQSSPTSLVVQVDAEAPNVAFTSCPADVVLQSSAVALWGASDPSSGLATPASGSIALDTATIGNKSVIASATDNVAHAASATCAYRVIFDFTGFLKPLLAPPDATTRSAGDSVPVSFSLAGDQGLAIIAAGYPQSAAITCGTSPSLETGEPTATSPRGLAFSPGAGGRYTYMWRTDASWAGTCRQLIVKLIDGTYHRANFSFE